MGLRQWDYPGGGYIVVPPAAGGGGGGGGGPDAEPVYTPGVSTLVMQDNFDSYSLTYDSVAHGYPAGENIRSQLMSNREGGPWLWVDYDLVGTHGVSLVTGRGGSGYALRLSFDGTAQEEVQIQAGVPNVNQVNVTWWFRVTSGLNPGASGTGSGIKWFELWHPNDHRWTFGVGHLTGGPTGYENTGLEFSAHDNFQSSPINPFMQNVSKAGRFGDYNDGTFHRITYSFDTSAANRGTKIWTEGVLRLSTWEGYPGVPTGGLGIETGLISMLKWYDVLVDSTPGPFWMDVDDVVVWY